jgi:hypothetical protein
MKCTGTLCVTGTTWAETGSACAVSSHERPVNEKKLCCPFSFFFINSCSFLSERWKFESYSDVMPPKAEFGMALFRGTIKLFLIWAAASGLRPAGASDEVGVGEFVAGAGAGAGAF